MVGCAAGSRGVIAQAVLAALNLPAPARVDHRVPKKLLLENGAPTSADKRLINEGIEAIQWLAVLKPATCGSHVFKDDVREYLEIAVLLMTLREQAKESRLIELLHRAVPYPVLLLIESPACLSISLAHKRHALKEADRVVLDEEPVTTTLQPENSIFHAAFLQAMDLSRQPRNTLYSLYQGWLDTVVALQAARVSGSFSILDSTERAQQRRQSLHATLQLQAQITELRRAAVNASQLARQVEMNLRIRNLESALKTAKGGL